MLDEPQLIARIVCSGTAVETFKIPPCADSYLLKISLYLILL